MVNNKVWEVVPIDKIPEGTKIMTSAWAMKKSDGTYRARINARGFEQVDGEHCDQDMKSSQVTCIVTIRIEMTLIIMSAWAAHLMGVHGAFLKGKFKDGEVISMQVPQGFVQFYPRNNKLLLLRTIYGLVQAALPFSIGSDSCSIRTNEVRQKQGRSILPPTIVASNLHSWTVSLDETATMAPKVNIN
jgi:hypothetical protein